MPKSNVSALFYGGIYGGCWIVVTRVDGLPEPECLAGPFTTEQAALDWIDEAFD